MLELQRLLYFPQNQSWAIFYSILACFFHKWPDHRQNQRWPQADILTNDAPFSLHILYLNEPCWISITFSDGGEYHDTILKYFHWGGRAEDPPRAFLCHRVIFFFIDGGLGAEEQRFDISGTLIGEIMRNGESPETPIYSLWAVAKWRKQHQLRPLFQTCKSLQQGPYPYSSVLMNISNSGDIFLLKALTTALT